MLVFRSKVFISTVGTTLGFHGYAVHQWYQSLYYPTNAQCENVELLKRIKIIKAAPTCFGLKGNHHQGATTST